MFLVLSMAAVCSLVQFPFSAPIYFCYVAPLAILASLAVLARLPRIPGAFLAVVFLFFLLLAVLRVTPTFIYNMRDHFEADKQTSALDLPGAGNLRVKPSSAVMYKELIRLVKDHAGSGQLFAGPDCPEVYFLAGYRNPTPTLFDFLEEPKERTQRIRRLIESGLLRAVVINNKPSFSGTLPKELRHLLTEHFPERAAVGHFEVRWRP